MADTFTFAGLSQANTQQQAYRLAAFRYAHFLAGGGPLRTDDEGLLEMLPLQLPEILSASMNDEGLLVIGREKPYSWRYTGIVMMWVQNDGSTGYQRQEQSDAPWSVNAPYPTDANGGRNRMVPSGPAARIAQRYHAGEDIQSADPDVRELVSMHTSKPLFGGLATRFGPGNSYIHFSGEAADGNTYQWSMCLTSGIITRELLAVPRIAPLRNEYFGKPPPMQDGCHVRAEPAWGLAHTLLALAIIINLVVVLVLVTTR